MKLKLKNFRCYSEKDFDFSTDDCCSNHGSKDNSNNLVLVTAPSGAGKSTILMAIYFALYGSGLKLATYGKTACSVELEFDGLKIIRTKRPNRLVVNDVYEDAAGQSIINKKFGTTFDVTGYISQNQLKSFILMSPTDKLAFLERFAFKDLDLVKIKERCKTLVSKRNTEFSTTITQLDMANTMVDELEIPKVISFPIKCSNNNIPKVSKNEGIKHKNCVTIILRKGKDIKKLESELADTRVLNTVLNNLREKIENNTQELDKLEKEKDILDDYMGDEDLKNYEKQLSFILSKKELVSLEEKLTEDRDKLKDMKEKEEKEYDDWVKKVKERLWKEYEKDEINDLIKENTSLLKDVERLRDIEGILERLNKNDASKKTLEKEIKNKEKLEKELKENEKLLEKAKLQDGIYVCPSCESNLRFHDEELCLEEEEFTDEIDKDMVKKIIKTLKGDIKNSEKTIESINSILENKNKIEKEQEKIKSKYELELELDSESIKEDLEYIRTYKADQTNLERSLENKNKHSNTLLDFEKGVKRREKDIEKRKKDEGDDFDIVDEEELRKTIIRQKKFKDRLEEIENNQVKIQTEIKKTEEKLGKKEKSHIEKYEEIRDEDTLRDKVKEYEKDVSVLEQKKEGHSQTLKNIEKYNEYIKEKEKYDSFQNKIKGLKKEEKVNKDKYASSTLLKEKILEAESIAIMNVIDSINTHAQIYLECFFPDNPMSVRLLPFKETKKNKKPQINLEIEYKGMECDINMLSGGELSRVILAFTLALADMFNTPILLLDECTASLDQDLTTTVFNSIREHFNGKLVIIIAHQVVTGVFDKTIKLE